MPKPVGWQWLCHGDFARNVAINNKHCILVVLKSLAIALLAPSCLRHRAHECFTILEVAADWHGLSVPAAHYAAIHCPR